MEKQILILGAGFGGLEAATSLRQRLEESIDITLIDKNDFFIIGFAKFDVMFGRRTVEDVKSYYTDLAADVNFVRDTIERIDVKNKAVKTSTAEFSYDILIVALGADLAPEAIPGFLEGGYEFYSLPGADKLRPVINDFQSGTILMSVLGAPYKCPPAPYEAAFQMHDLFVKKGIRGNITFKMLIPGPMPLPVAKAASATIEHQLAQRNIEFLPKTKVVELDAKGKLAIIENGEAIPYDLFIGVPLHKPPKVILESKLGQNGWISVNKHNLETDFPDVYAIGDVTKVPAGHGAVSKAGAFAEGGAKVVVNDILNRLKGEDNPVKFEAIGTCYFEFGAGKIAKLNANFLGNPEPRVLLDGPSAEFRQDKIDFEKSRIKKWFK